jgi:hypothetical protein
MSFSPRAGRKPVSSTATNLERVLRALERHGVELTPDGGVRPIGKRRL